MKRVAIFSTLVALVIFTSQARAAISLADYPLGTVVSVGDALFQHTDTKHTNPDAFLTTQDDHSNPLDGIVAAFNGSAVSTGNPEAIFSGGKTHTILVSDIPTTTDDIYRVFLFDGNQDKSGSDTYIDIMSLKVYISMDANLDELTGLASLTPIYDLDALGDVTLRVDGNVGSGGADMFFYLPDYLFGTDEAKNVYLSYAYTNFNDGPDAWLLDKDFTYTNPVPEPATFAIWSVVGLFGLGVGWKRQRHSKAD